MAQVLIRSSAPEVTHAVLSEPWSLFPLLSCSKTTFSSQLVLPPVAVAGLLDNTCTY